MRESSRLVLSYFNQLSCEKNILVGAVIELLTQCNVSCKHCYLPEHNNKGLTKETVINLLHELRNAGVIEITFTGGEIFLREDIFELIEEARKLYMRVFLLTNSTLINEERAIRLKELHVTQVSTTLFSIDPEIHDYITGVKDSHERTVKGIKNLKNSDISVVVKMPIMKYNVSEIRKVYDFCIQNQLEFLASPTIFQKNDGNKSPEKLQATGKDLCEAVKLIDELEAGLDYGNVNHYERKKKYDVPCIAIFSSLAIDSVGDVYPCNSLLMKIGNIYENTIQEIWNESEKLCYLKSIKKNDLKLCNQCEYVSECTRCPGLALGEDNSILGCDPFARKLAQIRSKGYVI